MARRSKKAPPPVTEVPETRRDRFVRLMTARMQRALNSIRLIGNLASANYEWRTEDIEAVRAAIVETTETSLGRFAKHRRGEKIAFKLPEPAASG